MAQPRILLADDHPHVLVNLCRLADEVGEVVGAIQDGRAVISEAQRLRPDVLILDLTMPGLNGIAATRIIRKDMPDTKIVMCTVHTHPMIVEEAFSVGAVGFVRKQSAHTDLGPAIRAALVGNIFVSQELREGGKRQETPDTEDGTDEGESR